MSFFQHLPLATIFGLLGNTISFMVFLSPIPTFCRICKKKSTEGYQSIPYVVALFSSMLWMLYAFLTPDSTFLKTINSFGCFIETIYITIFLVYATRKAKVTATKLIMVMNVAGFGAIAFVTFVIAKTPRVRVQILGWVCLIFSLCVFVAPLGVMRQVIRSKSVKYMPFLLSFFLTISAVMWFFYGLVRHDYYVAIPNVLGFSFGIVQMVLYGVYRNSKTAMGDVVIEGKKDPFELATPTTRDHQMIEVVKLGLSATELPPPPQQKEETYSIEIHNVDQETIERMRKIIGNDEPTAVPISSLVTVAAA